MAKSRRPYTSPADAALAEVTSMLGAIGKRVDTLKHERAAVAADLDQLITLAHQMKADLYGERIDRRRKFGQPGATGTGRKMSPEGRERIAAAAKRRWAKYRKAKGID